MNEVWSGAKCHRTTNFEGDFVAGEVWKKTPIDIVDKIVRYTGKMRLRNGIFMNQIDQDDIRYVVVRKIPEKIYTYDPISNTHNSYVYFTPFKNNMDKLVVKYEHKYVQHTLFKYSFEDGFNACFDWID